MPAYFVSAIEDHIAPWKTTYAGTQLLERQDRDSCCRARATSRAWSIRRPRTNTATGPTTSCPAIPDAWFADAKQHEGSWWPNWRQWVTPYLGREVPARVPGKGKLKVIEAAPGTYARIRADGK